MLIDLKVEESDMDKNEMIIIGQNNCIDQIPAEIWEQYKGNAVFSTQEEEDGRLICFIGIKIEPSSERFVLTHEDDWDYSAFSCVESDGKVKAINKDSLDLL